jgi:hypothetical protein
MGKHWNALFHLLMKGFLRDNGLSFVLVVLFLLFLTGQSVAGWLNYNAERDEHHQPQIGFMQYLATGAFGEAVLAIFVIVVLSRATPTNSPPLGRTALLRLRRFEAWQPSHPTTANFSG